MGRAARLAPACLALVSAAGIAAVPATAAPDVEFHESIPETTREGHVTLDWKHIEGQAFEVQKATQADFSDARVLLRGRGHSLFVSGLERGSNYFRIRALDTRGGDQGSWSQTLEIQVDYPSRAEVIALMAVGAAVFLILVTAIVSSFLRDRRTESTESAAP